MPRKPAKLFPKPTAIAVVAAILGIAVHGAVFFLVRIEATPPAPAASPEPRLTFLGEVDPETTALIDPLTLLIRSEQSRPGPTLEDFRSLSISREISPFPPSLKLDNSRNWTTWMPAETAEENPGSWLLERTESSLQNFGRTSLPDLRPSVKQVTVRIVDLLHDRIETLSYPLPEPVGASLREANFPNPPTFLLDRTDLWSRPQALLLESSGDPGLDQALLQILSRDGSRLTRRGSYALLTYYLPPVDDLPEEATP